MSNFKLWLLKTLLKEFCDKELDQWELLKVKSKYGFVYLTASREPLSGADESYTEL